MLEAPKDTAANISAPSDIALPLEIVPCVYIPGFGYVPVIDVPGDRKVQLFSNASGCERPSSPPQDAVTESHNHGLERYKQLRNDNYAVIKAVVLSLHFREHFGGLAFLLVTPSLVKTEIMAAVTDWKERHQGCEPLLCEYILAQVSLVLTITASNLCDLRFDHEVVSICRRKLMSLRTEDRR